MILKINIILRTPFNVLHSVLVLYVCGRKKNLNRTLEIDSPFQTLTVGLLVEFID